MTRTLVIVTCLSLAGAGTIHAEDSASSPKASADQAKQSPTPVQPPTAAPTETPPAPPELPPPPPQDDLEYDEQAPAPAAPGPRANGQWVYTSQYGWIFMPYGDQYTYEGTLYDAYPYSYVYYPDYGWLWLASPWVWGWGPYPYFGLASPWYFGWYSGLYRSGWGWGTYRGGGPRGSFGRPLPGYHGGARASGYVAPRANMYHAAPNAGAGARYGGYGGGYRPASPVPAGSSWGGRGGFGGRGSFGGGHGGGHR